MFRPGDLVTLCDGRSFATLYSLPGPVPSGGAKVTVIDCTQVGLVLARHDPPKGFSEVLVLFGARYGWREATLFQHVRTGQ